jgi:hypothetical protein
MHQTCIKNPLSSFSIRFCSQALLFCALAVSIPAQSITNPSFEANSFAVAPGTVAANGPITGWTFGDSTRAGLNPAGGASPYNNNGIIPNGNNVLWLQPTNYASTIIDGLTPGATYNVTFRANGTTSTNFAKLRIGVDATRIIDIGGVAAVGAGQTWHFVSFNFAATAPAQTLYLTNDGPLSTNYVLLDDFKVNLTSTGWSFAIWTNDASAGVDAGKNFTHAFSFNNAGTTPVISNVVFTRTTTVTPQFPYEMMTLNLPSATTDGGNVLRNAGGGSSNLASQFFYGGNPEMFTLNNLVPGTEYELSFYSVAWDVTSPGYGRTHTWSRGSDKLTVNQDYFSNDVGIRVSYRYIAPASGFITVSNTPLSLANGAFHCYGLANHEVNSQTLPIVGVQPANKVSIPGSGASFYVTAGGARPLFYRWSKDGVEIPNATNRFLNLTNLSDSNLGSYSVTVSNSFGVVPSVPATLSWDSRTIPNPSFEAETFINYPGYAGGNFPISGWFVSNTNRVGLNPVAEMVMPFANSGTVPEGKEVAFIQSPNPGASVLGTIITNLTVGQSYTLDFAASARTGAKPAVHVSVDGQSLADAMLSTVGTAGTYRRIAVNFTPTSSSATLALTNDVSADTTLLVDDFQIKPLTTKWSYDIWTNDASSGVDQTKLYTHAYNFGSVAVDTSINGVTFRGLAGANPSLPDSFTTAGFPSVFAGPDVNSLTASGAGSAAMAQQFVYGGQVQTITLTNLYPGLEYLFSLYSVGFDNDTRRTNNRAATFAVGNDKLTINQDQFGNDIGIRISYRYVPDASGAITLSYTATDVATTIHTYGFANYQLSATKPIIGAQPKSAYNAVGDTATLFVTLSAGAQPTYYQWQFNGADIQDQTNALLVLNNLTTAAEGSYQVIISNYLGSVTSILATVDTGIKFSGVFNTGVDDSGVTLPGGVFDPHYQMTVSADPAYPGPGAFVLTDNYYPVTNGVYMTNNGLSAWISPRTNSSVGNAVGLYVYETSFVIDSEDPARSKIAGLWASDNDGLDIRLNGISLGVSNSSARTFGSLAAFSITNGFVAGSNVLDFVITNLPPAGPTAFRAELSGFGKPLVGVAPQISVQPHDTVVNYGTNLVLDTVALGSGPLLYQWYYYGFELTDETNRVLRLNNIAPDQAGEYYVIVTNSINSVTSQVATVDVIVPPNITVDPQNQSFYCGDSAQLSVAVEGTEPFTYQWYFGTNAIPGANAEVVLLGPAQFSMNGSYYVIVANSAGKATSAVAVLTVSDNDPPFIAQQPRSLVVNPGSNATFTVVATSCEPLTYQWYFGATLLTGETRPSLTVTNAQQASAGNYTVNVSNSGWIVPSSPASLSVITGQIPEHNHVVISTSANGYLVRFAGDPGTSYKVLRSTELPGTDWTVVDTITAPSSGLIEYEDTNPPAGSAFYQIQAQ